ncbi:MAG TPA: 3-oxoacyl-[acyl-carrier-protein] synthase III C-terminal domain-containing protein [Burkholderiales bacterium]|nr:3-oxoacyl-[acyl-carrier-protein] synthase III C-terminal domain-containing protein [Burkholderiales bacterium]
MFFLGLGTATPLTRYTQAQCYAALEGSPQFRKLDSRSRALLRGVLTTDNGIATRALALDPLSDALDARPDVLHARFVEHAPGLAHEAAQRALADAGCAARDIDGVIVSTCTGYLCPGLTSYVIESLGLAHDTVALDLVGQGCGAALPNLSTAQALLAARRCDRVLSVCVEVCSAAVYVDDDPGVLVSACLFSDGAGAAVLGREPASSRRSVQWKTMSSSTDPLQRDLLRFEQRGGMLRNILTREVPERAGEAAARMLGGVLGRAHLTQSDIATWIWHSGGRTVLEALQREIGLDAQDIRWSAQVLRDYGNVSSACVYFVLEAALRGGAAPGWWWMSSFGAGFSCHGALLHVSNA